MFDFATPFVLFSICFGLVVNTSAAFVGHRRVRRPCYGRGSNVLPNTLIAASSDDNDPFLDFDPRISPLSQPPKSSSSSTSGSSSNNNNNNNNNNNSGGGSMDLTSSVSRREEKTYERPPPPKATADDDDEEEDTGVNSLFDLLAVNERVAAARAEIDEDNNDDDDDEAKNDDVEDSKNNDDPFADFDPRVSPHMYPGGTSSSSSGSEEKRGSDDVGVAGPPKIGVVLVDHGSKREASNAHLETVARAYQERCPPHFVVRAAHMEIASPSIAEVVDDLVFARGIDRVVCHPYFLSPGRHAVKDVPRLIRDAEADVRSRLPDDRTVRIVTTTPTGSQMKQMLDAVSTSVERTVREDLGGSGDEGNDGGMGFLGDVMRMMEEQMET